jgi:hypothetical protein
MDRSEHEEFIEVDEQTLQRIMKKILIRESINIKDKSKSDPKMVKDIQKIIEEETNAFK